MNYEPQDARNRDTALKWFRQQARDCQRLIMLNEDPNKTSLAPEYTAVLVRMLDSYRATIERLVKTQFGMKGTNV